MKRFSIRSKSDSSTIASVKSAPPAYQEDLEKAERDTLLPPHPLEKTLSDSHLAEDSLIGDDQGLKLLSLGEVNGVPPVGTLVFVHGLGGHFVRTWSHDRDSEFFWPKVWLPTTDGLRAVRIMSFGYDAGIFRFTPSLACVSDFARSLLLNIMVYPGLDDDKAYNMASSPGSEYGNIAARIKGIIFFATPHRGASSATLLKNMLRVTQLTAAPEKYISDLEPDSALIDHINETFRNSSKDLELVSFYETHSTPIGPLSKFIVNKESATMGLPGEYRAAVAASHCNICWFRNRYEANYLLVSRTLGHMVKTVLGKAAHEQPLESSTKKMSSIPFPRNQDFLGHEATLIVAEDEFAKAKRAGYTPIVAFHGFPGVGKTQLAIEFVYRHTARWSVFWVRADNQEILLQEFRKLASMLGIKTPPDNIVPAVKQWLRDEAGSDWVMVFDNADDISIVSDFLPTGTNGGILLSSRDPRLSFATRSIEVEVLARDEAIELLQRRAHIEASDATGNLVDLLGALPLAIEQAAAYIRERHISVDQFIKLYESKKARSRVLSRQITATRYTNTDSVYGTISIAISKLEEVCPLAARLIKIVAFLDAQDLPLDLLSGALSVDSDPNELSGLDDLDILDAMEGLESSALAIRKKHKSSIWVHVLVQAIVLEKLDVSGDFQKCMHTAMTHMTVKFAEARREGTWRAMQPHALKLMSLCEGYPLPLQAFDTIFNMFYMVLWDMMFNAQEGPSLLQLANSLLDRLLKAYGPHDVRTIRFLRFLGHWYYSAGKVPEAEAACKKALENPIGWDAADERTLREVARTQRMLSTVYSRDGQSKENVTKARDIAKLALGIEEGFASTQPLETAFTRETIGHACRELGYVDEAAEHFALAFEEVKGTIGLRTTMCIKTLHNLGGHQRLAGLTKAAEQSLQTARACVDEVFGFEHYTKGKILDSLGEVYYDLKDYANSIECYSEALALQLRIFPGDLHHEPGKSIMSLSIVYRAMGKFDLALVYAKRALATREAEFGIEHVRTGEALTSVALTHEDMGECAKADEIWEKLKAWHGEGRFTRETKLKLCYNFSINWSAEEYWLYDTRTENLAD